MIENSFVIFFMHIIEDEIKKWIHQFCPEHENEVMAWFVCNDIKSNKRRKKRKYYKSYYSGVVYTYCFNDKQHCRWNKTTIYVTESRKSGS